LEHLTNQYYEHLSLENSQKVTNPKINIRMFGYCLLLSCYCDYLVESSRNKLLLSFKLCLQDFQLLSKFVMRRAKFKNLEICLEILLKLKYFNVFYELNMN